MELLKCTVSTSKEGQRGTSETYRVRRSNATRAALKCYNVSVRFPISKRSNDQMQPVRRQRSTSSNIAQKLIISANLDDPLLTFSFSFVAHQFPRISQVEIAQRETRVKQDCAEDSVIP